MNWKEDQNRTPRCPVPHVFYTWDDDTDERIAHWEECGEEVALIVTCRVPLEIGIELSALSCGIDANTSCWEVKCDRGHVLAISDHEETAEAFTWSVVFPTSESVGEDGGDHS